MSLQKIAVDNYTVFVGNTCWNELSEMVNSDNYSSARFFVLVDEHTLAHCWPILANAVPQLQNAEIIEINSGESEKNLDICYQLWKVLDELEADRHSVMIQLGGGVIGDMGGFVAATFKRGIRFIQLPTTLLAQVDASVGGKTGVDFEHKKNQVGVFANPDAVFIAPQFLDSLTDDQLRSGSAEMFKHALVADPAYWEVMCHADLRNAKQAAKLITRSVEIKRDIVTADPHENGWRKLLNFGHTIGHAFETMALESDGAPLQHGDAVAAGMICETYLSQKLNGLPKEDMEQVCHFLAERFPAIAFEDINVHRLLELMRSDKKNSGGRVNFTFLEKIGKGSVNHTAENNAIVEALYYYRELVSTTA